MLKKPKFKMIADFSISWSEEELMLVAEHGPIGVVNVAKPTKKRNYDKK